MIHGLSEIRRLPRQGKIRLGVMVHEPGKKPYPRACDYFVCPPEVIAVLGEQPKKLPIMFPVDNPSVLFPQALRMYKSAGLWCMGDNRTARRWDERGNLAELPCPCPYLESGECGAEATLNFLLPTVPGIGVWTITTGNKASIIGLNSALEQFARAFNGLRGIPFTLILEPLETQRYDEKQKGMTKVKIQALRLSTDKTLLDVIAWRQAIGATPEPLMLPAETDDGEEEQAALPARGPEKPVGPAGETLAEGQQRRDNPVGGQGASGLTPPGEGMATEARATLWTRLMDATGNTTRHATALLRKMAQEHLGRPVELLDDLDDAEVQALLGRLEGP